MYSVRLSRLCFMPSHSLLSDVLLPLVYCEFDVSN